MLVSGQFTVVYFFSVFVKDLELVSSPFESLIVIKKKKKVYFPTFNFKDDRQTLDMRLLFSQSPSGN